MEWILEHGVWNNSGVWIDTSPWNVRPAFELPPIKITAGGSASFVPDFLTVDFNVVISEGNTVSTTLVPTFEFEYFTYYEYTFTLPKHEYKAYVRKP